MKRLYDYTIIIRPEDNGTFAAYVPAIVGCLAWGKTPDEAQAELIMSSKWSKKSMKKKDACFQKM